MILGWDGSWAYILGEKEDGHSTCSLPFIEEKDYKLYITLTFIYLGYKILNASEQKETSPLFFLKSKVFIIVW